MRDFEYEAPTALSTAIELLAQQNGSAKPLAGGTDLIDHVRTGRLEPDLLVDVKKIDELNVLDLGSDGLRLGAAVPCYKIYGTPEISQQYAALTDSCRIIGGIQIQSRASVGGNLCNSGPAADSIPSLIVLGGVCAIAGPNGTREVAAEDFCTAPGKNVSNFRHERLTADRTTAASSREMKWTSPLSASEHRSFWTKAKRTSSRQGSLWEPSLQRLCSLRLPVTHWRDSRSMRNQ